MKTDNSKLKLLTSYCQSFEDFFILTREINDYKLKVMESPLIACDKPVLYKVNSSFPLEPF